MLHYEKSSLIAAPVEVVWQFYEREDCLKKLTPPWQPVEVVRREGGLGVGAISEFRLWLGLIPVPWISVHTDCIPFQSFTDIQQQGPLVSWQHVHSFTAEGNGTRLGDRIEYALPGGDWAEAWVGPWVTARLEDMFAYRHRVTAAECTMSA
jgi:ligand-binding SRPBCC domain-containing protein